MAKQIKPEQVINRIEQMIKEQITNEYKAGWIWHQMEHKVEQNHKHLCHAYNGANLPGLAHDIARGEVTIEEASNYLIEYYESYIAECDQFGLPENER